MWYNDLDNTKNGVLMKRKNMKTLLALLLSATCLTACSTSQKVSFSEYWRADSATKQDISETLEYAVTYESNDGATAYSLDYTNGKYVTTLTTETDENGKKYYCYKTELTVTAVYTFNGEVAEFNDRTLTEVHFEQSSSLKPTYSRKEFVNHSPVYGLTVSEQTALDECYAPYDYVVETTYSTIENGVGKCVVTNNEKTTTSENDFELDVEKYTYLDNEQLLFALRGIKATASTAHTFMVYSPFARIGQRVKATFSSKEGTEFSYRRDGTDVKETIEYYPASIVLNEKNSGTTQTAWYAAITNPQSNTYRNVMLRLEVPLTYSLGTLTYQLTSANFAA